MNTGRCFICYRPGCTDIISLPVGCPHTAYLCTRHAYELAKVGWESMSDKYDYLDNQLSSLGLRVFGDRLIYQDFREWRTHL